MKRRAFFSGLFSSAAIVSIPAAATSLQEQGVMWRPKCPCCDKQMRLFVPVADAPITAPTQCPDCLSVLDMTELGELLKAYNKARGVWS